MKTKGITLIALVITIIVMLILAGVGITFTTGILNQAKGSTFIDEMAKVKENLALKDLENQLAEANGEESVLFSEAMSTSDWAGINAQLKNEILYNRDKLAGTAGDKLPTNEDYTNKDTAFEIDEEGNITDIFYVDKELTEREEKAYIYDKQSEEVYRIEPEVIDGVPVYSSGMGNLLLGNSGILNKLKDKLSTDIGKEVALKDGWFTETVTMVRTEDGSEVEGTAQTASVYAVSVGEGEVVPVPKGFYYVGGNLSTGVIISDNELDKYDGVTDKTAHDYNRSLQGNQFVWIPCTEEEYKKTAWGTLTDGKTNSYNANWDNTTYEAELTQIKKYGGFYVARYEAGLANTIEEFTTTQSRTSTIYNKAGMPQSRAGQIPWMFVDWTNSKANAESMYDTEYVHSGLITGTQWDVMLNTLMNKAGLTETDMKSSGTWGNYKDTAIEYTGRLAKGTYSSNTWYLEPFGEEVTETGIKTTNYGTGNGGDLLTTGASATTEKYHIYDVAGNLWEWTEEASANQATGTYRMARGGCFWDATTVYTACYRAGNRTVGYTDREIGFRPVLYIK